MPGSTAWSRSFAPRRAPRQLLEADDFVDRQQPHQHRRRRGVRARSGQPDPPVLARRQAQPRIPSGRDAAATRSLQADRQDAARRRGSQPAVPRHPDLAQRARTRAAAHERGRRARPVHPRFRPHRRDDAVQHVSPLHGRRAPAALASACSPRSRRAADRASTRSPTSSCHDPAATARRSTSRCSCTTSPRAGPRIIRSPAPRSRAGSARVWGCAGRDRDRRLAGRAPSGDVDDRRRRATSTTARPSRISPPSCRSLERLKLLLMLTVADIRRSARASGTAGRASCCARSTTRPSSLLTGGFSEVDRARRVARRRRAPRRSCPTGRTRSRRLCRAPLRGLLAQRRSGRRSSSTRASSRAAEAAGQEARHHGQDPTRSEA